MKASTLIGLVVALSGCDLGTTSPDAPEPPASEQASTLDLARRMPPDAQLVGVAITPAGKRYVLDQRSGLYEVNEAAATLRFNTTGLAGIELTDVVALDESRFALTAENDGFLLDLDSGQLSTYFCYLPALPPDDPANNPGGTAGSASMVPTTPVSGPLSISQTLRMQGVEVSQRTESVAFNPDTKQLFAQPLTIRLDTGAVAGSELFIFDEGGAEPVQVLSMSEASFVAGGMTTLGNRLLLGSERSIFEQLWSGTRARLATLDGAVDIAGMARAPDGTVWVLDGRAKRLIRVDGI
jgi:hypothetical protein